MSLFAYIGTLNKGGTCLMRGEMLQQLLPGSRAFFIDTIHQFTFLNRVFQSLGFRYKIGPLISEVNHHIQNEILKHNLYDFIWVDKAVYLTPETTKLLKSKTNCLVHYTPDTAFYANRSRFFLKSMPLYDYVITTKFFDEQHYHKYIAPEKLITCTQGFDPRYHKEYFSFENKEVDVVFIGLWEPHREKIMQALLDRNFTVKLGGHRWHNFINRNKSNDNLSYLGASVRNETYSKHIASARYSPGLLSKNFPERHTTRTFEIPACGTALLTESNEETRSFFKDDEAIFYESIDDMIEKIRYYKAHPEALKALTEKGRRRVVGDSRDYESILREVLQKTGVVL